MIELKNYASQVVGEEGLAQEVEAARALMGKLSEEPMAGWLNLPIKYDEEEFKRIKEAAEKIQEKADFLVCIGIGGSYLGHRAVIEALGVKGRTKILYAGNSLSPKELGRVLDELGDADFAVNVISKSGTTTEPAVAFRIFKQKLVEKYGEKGAAERIFATTDARKGALYEEAVAKGYERFVVPDDIGGRYSVLTAVGLLPIAVAGISIDELMDGAAEERAGLISDGGMAAEYAALRNFLYKKGYNVEVLSGFEPSLLYVNEWWKQLFGESEGKEGKGIFPASLVYTTDLHSMGQYMQEGRREVFETMLRIVKATGEIVVPAMDEDLDGLGYLEGKKLSYINEQALIATREAHLSGGVPVIGLELPEISARTLGALMYFFELSCALSGLLLGVDPFNQPGVEAYKNNMFELLGKPKK